MDNTTTQTYNVIWLDPVATLVDAERSSLRAAGMKLLTVPTPEDLRRVMENARALVIRLSRDTALLSQVQDMMRGFRSPLPVVCRVDRHRLDVGVQAMHEGAAHVLASDEWSEESWRAVLGRLPMPAAPKQEAFVFVDPNSQKLLELARRVAQAGVTTLLTGPTGAGKEVLARVLHDASPRSDGPFVGLNCAAMPESMIEDLLFGHEKGAFTGATREHPGVFGAHHQHGVETDDELRVVQCAQAGGERVRQLLGGARLLVDDAAGSFPGEDGDRVVGGGEAAARRQRRERRRALQFGEAEADLARVAVCGPIHLAGPPACCRHDPRRPAPPHALPL